MYWSMYQETREPTEDICYDTAHVTEVLSTIEENFFTYFENFVDFNATKNFGRIIGTAIKNFEHDRDDYKEIFSAEAMEEYEDDTNAFKSDVLKNDCPVIRKTLNSKRKELEQSHIAIKS